MRLHFVLALVLAVGLAHASRVRADALPACPPMHHWEGGHGGECRMGFECLCAAPGASAGDPRALAVAALALVGLAARRRARR